jgi:hypothetical protein
MHWSLLMNILRYPLLKTLLKNRWPQFSIMLSPWRDFAGDPLGTVRDPGRQP